MWWSYTDVASEMGIEEGLPCSVCGCTITDIIYFPEGLSDRQATWIQIIWKCDPYTEFCICEDCMEGHCGAVSWLTPDNWLEERIEKFRDKNNDNSDNGERSGGAGDGGHPGRLRRFPAAERGPGGRKEVTYGWTREGNSRIPREPGTL